MDKNQKKKLENFIRKKKRNGIWFSNSEALNEFAVETASKLEIIIENIIFYGLTVPMQLIQSAGVFAISFYNDSFMELSFFLLGFFFTRSFLGETFHLNSTITCTTFTWTVFFLVTSFVPSIYVSVFLSILLGCGLSLYMNYTVTKEELKCRED